MNREEILLSVKKCVGRQDFGMLASGIKEEAFKFFKKLERDSNKDSYAFREFCTTHIGWGRWHTFFAELGVPEISQLPPKVNYGNPSPEEKQLMWDVMVALTSKPISDKKLEDFM